MAGRRGLAVLLVLGVVVLVVVSGVGNRGSGEGDRADRRQGGLSASRAQVAHVIDGDTVVLRNGEHVRLVGIDTPERDQCGYDAARDALAALVEDRDVTLTRPEADRDRYDRLLRYVDVGRVDAGLRQIQRGLAVARYDSRDGYAFHPRQPSYVKADKAAPDRC